MVAALCRAIRSALLLTAVACGDNTGVGESALPKAFIRYVNAMPDTLGVDFRAVDIVENTPYITVLFREIKQAGYTPVASGARHFRAFLSDTANATAGTVSSVLVDTTIDLRAGARYTIVQAGFARAGQTPRAALEVFRDSIPIPPAGHIAIRVVNLGAALGAADVYATTSRTSPLPAVPLIANARYLTPTGYVFVPKSATLAFRANAAGAGNTVAPFASVDVPIGDPGTGSLDPVPGSSIEGSVLTVYVFARSSPNSRAPQSAAFQIPSLAVVPDVQLYNRPQE